MLGKILEVWVWSVFARNLSLSHCVFVVLRVLLCLVSCVSLDTGYRIFFSHLFFPFLVNPCVNKTCPSFKECILNNSFDAVCVCRSACPLVYTPVCGSNGKTYPNKCAMDIDSCQSNQSLALLHEGFCSKCCFLL